MRQTAYLNGLVDRTSDKRSIPLSDTIHSVSNGPVWLPSVVNRKKNVPADRHIIPIQVDRILQKRRSFAGGPIHKLSRRKLADIRSAATLKVVEPLLAALRGRAGKSPALPFIGAILIV
jgi:hypothetical protein